MQKNRKIAMLAAVGAALAVAGGGAAIAATGVLSPEEESQAVIDDAAAQLGVEPSELSNALEQALKNRIDDAVEAGRLTEAQGNALKERLDSADLPLIFGGRGFGPHGFDHGDFGHFASLEAAASYLGLTEAELRSELADGKSLAEIAKSEGKSVDGLVQALVKSASARLDQAVKDGKLTKAQADEITESLEERITDLVNREPGSGHGFMRRPGFGHDFGHGFDGSHRRPPESFGPRA
jgi:polyhydroxyalkanoate synthesis regulator phasin